MTHPHDPLDDALRDALRAEAHGAEADDALLDRIREAKVPSRGHRTPLLLAAAVAVVAALAGTLAITRSDDQRVRLVDGPEQTTTTRIDPSTGEPCLPDVDVIMILRFDAPANAGDRAAAWLDADPRVADVRHIPADRAFGRLQQIYGPRASDFIDPADPRELLMVNVVDLHDLEPVVSSLSSEQGTIGLALFLCAGAPPTPTPTGDATTYVPDSPDDTDLVALVREDGWLVTVDLRTGDQRELVTAGDPNDRDEETGMSYFIDDVELDPDGQWIYFSTCCEPASGQTYRIEVSSPERQEMGDIPPNVTGSSPRVSNDGTRLATVAGDMILVFDLTDDGAGDAITYQATDGRYFSEISWSPRGNQLTAVSLGDIDDDRLVQYFSVDQTRIAPIAPRIEDDRRRFPLWGPGDGLDPAYPVDHIEDPDLETARDLRQDRTLTNLLWVQADGTLMTVGLYEYHPERPVPTKLLVPRTPQALAADW